MVNSSTGANSYEWDFGNGQTSTAVNPQATFDTVGTYTITLVTTNTFGCADSAMQTFEVGEQPLAQFTLNNAAGCGPLAVNFVNQTIDGVSYIWDFGDGESSTLANPVHVYTPPGTYNVSLTVSGSGICGDTLTLSSAVTVYDQPIADFNWDFSNPYEPDGNVQFTNLSTGASDYQWVFGDGETSTETDPAHFYNNHGDFNVVLTATNAFGCSDTAQATIGIEFIKGLFVPNAVMAEADGETGLFLPKGRGLADYHCMIFDKWGNLLWESSKLIDGSPAEGWDGTYKTLPVPMGAYIWKIDAIFDDGSAWEGMEFPTGKVDNTGTVMVIQ